MSNYEDRAVSPDIVDQAYQRFDLAKNDQDGFTLLNVGRTAVGPHLIVAGCAMKTEGAPPVVFSINEMRAFAGEEQLPDLDETRFRRTLIDKLPPEVRKYCWDRGGIPSTPYLQLLAAACDLKGRRNSIAVTTSGVVPNGLVASRQYVNACTGYNYAAQKMRKVAYYPRRLGVPLTNLLTAEAFEEVPQELKKDQIKYCIELRRHPSMVSRLLMDNAPADIVAAIRKGDTTILGWQDGEGEEYTLQGFANTNYRPNTVRTNNQSPGRFDGETFLAPNSNETREQFELIREALDHALSPEDTEAALREMLERLPQ